MEIRPKIPWYRKEIIASTLLLFGLPFPPLIWLVVVLLITGNIYTNKYNADGSIAVWSNANKTAAWIILVIQIIAICYVGYINSIL